jgi:hypothetical protein
MPRIRATLAGLTLLGLCWAVLPASAAAPDPDALFLQARQTWRGRTEAPFVSYAVRASYLFHNHLIADWFQLTYRASDGALSVRTIDVPGEAARKEGGFPFYIFGLKIFDTNPDADEIAMRQPAIDPAFTFGLMPHAFLPAVLRAAGDPTPDPDSARLREIGRVIAVNREYAISYAGEEQLRYGDTDHLTLRPLRDPQLNRLRDVWIEKQSHLLLRARVAGIYDGAPYDRVSWTVEYVPLDGRVYIQQVRTEQDMHFGIDRIAHMKLDFVDYRFPKDVPDYVFLPPDM